MKTIVSLFILSFLSFFKVEAQIKADSIPANSTPKENEILTPNIVYSSMDSVPAIIRERKIERRKQSVRDLFNFKKDYPSPKKALILTAVLPGLGQIYNKKYWKLPIVYGGVGSMVWLIIYNNREYNRYKTALKYRDDDDPETIDEFSNEDGVELVPDSSLKLSRNAALKNRELSYIGLAFSYILTGVDAFVDAHLLGFDVSDDLTLEWQPHYQILPNEASAMSLHFSFQHKAKKPVVYPVQF